MLAPGVLTLAATPIGNSLDASMRLVRALGDAELIAAEDTRRLHRLTAQLGVHTDARIISYHEHNETQRTPWLLQALEEGRRVLLVSDAGMPVVSDPGFRAVRAASDAGYDVQVIPGPSAVLTALAVSGLAPDRFCFEGFVPRGEGARRRLFTELAPAERTLVFFESPRRTARTLADMRDGFGPERQGVIARELTKTHEQVLRGTLDELARWAEENEVLGEVVLLVAGADTLTLAAEDVVDQVLARLAQGERMKDAARDVARTSAGVSARELYDLAQQRRMR